MLELLSRKIRTRRISEQNLEIPFKEEAEPEKHRRQQIVDDFIRKSSYHGEGLVDYSLTLLSRLASEKEISQAAFFISDTRDGKPVIKFLTGFAAPDPGNTTDILEFGEGFPGQVAKDRKLINISDIPQGYLSIESGLGKASPVSLIIFPVKHNDKVLAVIELASFHKFTQDDEFFFGEISPSIAEQIQKCIARS